MAPKSFAFCSFSLFILKIRRNYTKNIFTFEDKYGLIIINTRYPRQAVVSKDGPEPVMASDIPLLCCAFALFGNSRQGSDTAEDDVS